MNIVNGIGKIHPSDKDALVGLVAAILETDVNPEKKLISQGLDSLGAAELLDALHQHGLDVDYEFLLDEASINTLLKALREKTDNGPKPLSENASDAPFALTGPQLIWTKLEAQGWGAWANISLCLSVPASLIRATYLPAMAQSLCDANDAMRMVLVRHGHDSSEVLQRKIPDFQLPVQMRDAPALERDAMRLVEEFEGEVCSPFEPSTRALILSSPNSEGRHWICITMHHVFSDRLSMHSLAQQFRGMVANDDVRCAPPQGLKYADYAIWSHKSFDTAAADQSDDDLRSLIANADVSTRRPVPRTVDTVALNFEDFPSQAHLHPSEAGALERLASDLDTTLPLFIHAVSSVLVARLTSDARVLCGETDILLCHVVSNRERHESLKDMVGCLDTSVPVAVRLTKQETLKSLCQKTRRSFAAAYRCVSDIPRGGWLVSDDPKSGDYPSSALFERVPHINIVRPPKSNSVDANLDVREHIVRRVQKTRWGFLLRVTLPSSSDTRPHGQAHGGDDLSGVRFEAFAEDRLLSRLVPYCLVELFRLILREAEFGDGELDILEKIDHVLDRARFAEAQVRRASALMSSEQTGDAFIYDKLVARQQRWYEHDTNHALCRDAHNCFIGTAANPFPFTQLDKLKERRFLEERGMPLPKLLHTLPKEGFPNALVKLASTLPQSFAIKPVGAGHSFGVTLVRDGIDLSRNGAQFDIANVATELSEMADRGYCHHEGRVFPFNFSSFLIEELVVDEKGFAAPTDYKVFMIGEKLLWLQLHFKENGYNWVAFVNADFKLMPQPAWHPVTCWRTHRALVCTEQAMVDARRPKCLSGILEHSKNLAADMGIFVRLDWYADETRGPLMGEITTFPHMLQPSAFYTPWANELVKTTWHDPEGVALKVIRSADCKDDDPIARVEALLDKGKVDTRLEDFLPQPSQMQWAIDDNVTFGALHTYVKRFDLAPWGIARGARVGVLVANGVQLGALLIATINRYVAVPIGADLPASLIATQLEQSEIEALVVVGGSSEAQKAREIANQFYDMTVIEMTPSRFFALPALPAEHRVRDAMETTETNHLNDEVLVLRTSGSTGDAKSVSYTLAKLVRSSALIARSLELRPDDLGVSMLPLHHIGGIASNLFAPTLSSAPMRYHQAFDPKAFFDALGDPLSATWSYLVPAMWDRVLDYAKAHPNLRAAKPWQRLRIIRSAGAELPHDVAMELSDLFGDAVTILPTYAMTEAMPIASPPLSYRLDHPGSVGRVLPTVSVEIIDPTDAALPPVTNGIVGEITVKGAMVFDGYDEGCEPSSKSFTSRGYFRTGDLGRFSADGSGWLSVTGRLKETINAGGETIAPTEIEAALRHYPKWASDASGVHLMAFARSHKTLGEDVAIAVADASCDIDLADIYSWARAHLPFSMLPKTLVIVSALPRTSSGKLTRAKFAERFNAQVSPGELDVLQTFEWQAEVAAPCLRAEENTLQQKTEEPHGGDVVSLEQVIAFVQSTVGSEVEIMPDTHLSDAGVNSLAAVELSIQLNRQFHIDLPSWVLSDHPTPRALHSVMMSLKAAEPEPLGNDFDAFDQTLMPAQGKANPLRMLFLHGEGADAELMAASLRATHWKSRLAGDIEFIFMNAPHTCPPMPDFHVTAAASGFYTKSEYRSWRVSNSEQLEQSISAVTKAVESLGPIDAIGGICDGALLAAIVGSKSESLKVLLCVSPSPLSRLAQPHASPDWKIACRSIHLVSNKDDQHSLSQQFEIAEHCEKAFMLQHDRGHAIPVLERSLEREMRQALDNPNKAITNCTANSVKHQSRPTVSIATSRSSALCETAETFEPLVTDVMARILGRDRVERTQGFFDLGGDSLKALALVQELERKIGVDLPIEKLFLEGASVASLARAIAAQTAMADTGSVVSLNTSVSKAKIFALPTLSGNLTDYFALGAALDCTASLIGLKLGSLRSGSWPIKARLPDLAREAAASICDHSDCKEINLVGYSAAGVLAYETAKVLRERGFNIGCLALIDSDATSDGNKWPLPIKYVSEWQKELSRRLRGKINQRKRYTQLHFRAQLAKWNPSPIDVRWPVFFQADLGTIDEQELDKWRSAVMGNLDIVPIAGNHTSLRESDVAAQIAQFISVRMSLEDGSLP